MPGTRKISRRDIVSLKARQAMKRTWFEKCADSLAQGFGTLAFLLLNVIWFAFWLCFNSGVFPGLEPFDPYPFNFLTMTVSLEAIFLAIIVLISQNRAAKIEDLRQEVDLQLNIIEEQEITKMMEMLSKIMQRDHFNMSGDSELKEMLKPIDRAGIEAELDKQV